MKAVLTPESVGQRLADLPEALPDLQLLLLFGSPAVGHGEASQYRSTGETPGIETGGRCRDAARREYGQSAPPRTPREGRRGAGLLQETIEAALDINAHVIAELGGDVPEDYYGGFLKMAELGLLPSELAGSLASSAGPRNRLVHEYEAIDDAKVLGSIGTLLEVYPRYVQAVEAHLTKAGL